MTIWSHTILEAGKMVSVCPNSGYEPEDTGQAVWIDRYVWNEGKEIQLDHVRKEKETEFLSLMGTSVGLFPFTSLQTHWPINADYHSPVFATSNLLVIFPNYFVPRNVALLTNLETKFPFGSLASYLLGQICYPSCPFRSNLSLTVKHLFIQQIFIKHRLCYWYTVQGSSRYQETLKNT